MKYHKIPRVDKSVCTAEQKIAYNYAETYCYEYRKTWKESAHKYFGFQRKEFIAEAVAWCMKLMKNNKKIVEKYDLDAIQSALNAGMENYFNGAYGILGSYEEIGETFPALYLNMKE